MGARGGEVVVFGQDDAPHKSESCEELNGEDFIIKVVKLRRTGGAFVCFLCIGPSVLVFSSHFWM